MLSVGILAEYNPFHKGHLYQYQYLRRKLGERTAIVVLLTSNICQRGWPAIQSITRRARSAVLCGADLVILLPQAFSCREASQYAQAAMYLFAASKLVDLVAASSEIFDKKLLNLAAEIIQPESPSLKALVKQYLRDGYSPHQARSQAVAKLGYPELTPCFDQANARLCTEYIAALRSLPKHLTAPDFFLCPRSEQKVQAEDEKRSQASASTLRAGLEALAQSLADGIPEYAAHMPQAALAALLYDLQSGDVLKSEAYLRHCHYLLNKEGEDLLAKGYLNMQGGLAERLLRKARTEDILVASEARNFPAARIMRALSALALGLDGPTLEACGEWPAFSLVLAFNQKGRYLLKKRAKDSEIPLPSRFAELSQVNSEAARTQLKIERNSANLYAYLKGQQVGQNPLLDAPLYIKV